MHTTQKNVKQVHSFAQLLSPLLRRKSLEDANLTAAAKISAKEMHQLQQVFSEDGGNRQTINISFSEMNLCARTATILASCTSLRSLAMSGSKHPDVVLLYYPQMLFVGYGNDNEQSV